MIWGEAGVGKTTLCAKFCEDWALVVKEKEGKGQELTEEQKYELEKLTEEQKSKLNNIGLLFHIVLRDIGHGAKTVKDIILSQLGFHKEGTFMSQPGLKGQLLSILENVSEHLRLLLIMDGFDEISDKDKKIEAVITGETYQNIHCITTCRPHAVGDKVLKVDVEIRLKGFSEAQTKSFVEMYARIEYNEQDQIGSFVQQTMHQIKSSNDLIEMSTNPSMLQLLCRLLSWKKGKIGNDRTSIFKVYTRYLLMQYHIKIGGKKLYSDDLYKKYLLDAGKVALMGLKQNQLKLVFSKSEAQDICSETIFDIGFFMELPSTDTESVKVQFTHKTLQEYLAAFFVVNTPGDEGLQLLMEFCSTSQRLMGSQIILEFISNMSTDILGKEIQNEIKNFVSNLDSNDEVNPRNRTLFLISMLEGNATFKFPLPAVIDIDLTYPFFKKAALERFFGMDGQGVRKIKLTLGQENRLNVLQNTSISCLDKLSIANHWSRLDNEDLCKVMMKMKPELLCLKNCDWKSMNEATVGLILQHVNTLILEEYRLTQEHLLSILRAEHHLKDLTVDGMGYVRIEGEVIEAVSKSSSDIMLNVNKRLGCDPYEQITLKHKSHNMKSLSLSNCVIDTGIVEAVSRLPDHTEFNLSGNKLTKIDPRLLPGVLLHMSEDEEIDMTQWGITIDVDIVRTLSKMPQLKTLKALYNKLTPEAAREFSMSQLQHLHLNCCRINDTVCEPLMISLSKHCPLLERFYLGGNSLTSDKWCHHVQMKQLRKLNLADCGINDTVCVSLMISLTKHCPLLDRLDLSWNNLSPSGVLKILDNIKHMKKLRELMLVCNPCVQDRQSMEDVKEALQKSNPGLEVIH